MAPLITVGQPTVRGTHASREIICAEDLHTLENIETIQQYTYCIGLLGDMSLDLFSQMCRSREKRDAATGEREHRVYSMEYTRCYYDNVRVLTLMIKTLIGCFSKVFLLNGEIVSPSMQRYVNVYFKKQHEFREQATGVNAEQTEEEREIIRYFLVKVDEMCDLLEIYVTEK